MTTLIVPGRFCGPPSSGNGGWTAGALAALADGNDEVPPGLEVSAVEVSLRKPPPLDVPMPVTHEGDRTVASYDGLTVAVARCVDTDLVAVAPVGAEDARSAESGYPGLRAHPFPTCFSCGTARERGDGLRIFPGPVAAGGEVARVAATWTPHPLVAASPSDTAPGGRVSLPVTWAALDCLGGWSSDLDERPLVLGRMTAVVEARPVIGEEFVVVGALRRLDGRKTFTASSIYDVDGRLVARAEHLWIAIDPTQFG